jgi:outer membrane autotransporter protein
MLNVLARNEINIESTGSSAGVYFSGSTATGIFEAPEGNITMKSSNGNTASLSADDGASVRLYAAKDVTVGGDTQRAIRSRGDSTVDITSGWDNAIYLEATNTSGDNNAAIYTDDSGSVILHSNAVVNAVTNGVDANGGTVDFIKGLDMSGAATAINARNGGVVNASNEVSDKKITGNIFSDGTGSDVNVNFMTANSYFTGASAKSNGGTIDLALRNGGVWNVTGDSNLTTLTNNDNGIIDMTHTGNTMYETITTDDYQGNGGTIRMNTDLDSETNSDRLVITNGTTAANGYIQVYDKSLVDGSKVTGPKQLLLVQDNNGLTSWTGKSLDTGGVWNINPTVEQIGNDWYLVLGEGSVITPNTTAQTYFGFSDNAYGMWRSFLTDDTLRKRLGDLRYGAEDVSGVWARIKAGKLDASGYDADYQMYQGGYDKKSGNTAYGMAVNYMRSKLNYEAGYGHDTMNNMSLYATTYHDSGAYNDIVLSVGKYRSNVHVNPNDDYADYDAWAYSASYEVGKTYRQNHGWFVEPQGQLIYGHMQGTDSISNNGSAMHRDSINSFLGRAGVVLGRKVNDHSDYYLKANVYKEFAGDGDMCLDATDNYGTRQHITHSSDNKDTWFELGLGGNLKLSDNAYMYGDVLKTFGANINKKWQINLGLRWAIGSGVPKVVSQPVVEPAVEPVQPAPVVQEKQEAYYDSVHFGFDEDQPLTGEAAKVSRFAATAKAHPERTYAMVGNTDSVGTDAYNNDLSKRRVEHVKTLAEQQGVPAAQMQDSYLGKSHPVDTNETEQGRANNRRVDIYEHQ